MSQERPNKASGWISNLDALNMIPGETVFHSGAAWKKLENRMAAKKRVITPFWYWIAAASLILTLLIPFIPAKKTNTTVVLQEKKQSPVKTETSLKKINSMNVVKLPAINNRKINKIKTTFPAAITIKEIIPEIIPADTIAAPLVVNIVKARKKLQVVHINEITEPGNQEELTQHTRSNIHFNERNGDDFTKAYATNSSENIIKIKLPTN